MKCKQDEKALQENEEQYKAIFDNSLDGVFLTIPDGTILAANPAACQMFGMTEEEIIRVGRKGIVDISDPRLKSLLEERDRTGRFKGELNHRRKDGTIFPGEISSVLFKDKDGLLKGVIIIRDITARKQAEDALRRSEEQYRMLFANMTEGFGLVEVIYNNYGRPCDYRYLEVNPAFEIYLGVKREQLLGKTMRETFPKLTPAAIEKYNEVALSGQPINFEIFSHVANKYLDIRAFIPEKGKVALILREISERKEAEAKLKDTLDNLDKLVKERTAELQTAYNSLRKSEKSLAESQEIAHLGSWERDFSSNEYSWSDELYRIFGLKPEESKVNYDTFLNCVHPDDRNNVNNAVKESLNRKPLDTNFRIIRANGEERIIHAKAEVVFDENNNPVRIKGTTQDITEHRKAEEKLRESEEKYRNIAETANEGIIIIDDELKVTYANNKMMDMFGYTLEEGIGRLIWDFVDEDDKSILKQNLERRRQGINESYEFKLIRKDGSLLWVLINAKSLFDKDGKFAGSLSMLTDITERKKVEEALTNIETARKKEIHHRIKNNLQVISSLLDLQAEQFRKREDIRDSEVLEAFQESQDRVISMALIHEELYKGGGFETLNFSPYIQELADTLFQTYRLGNADISLKLDLEENISFDMDTAVPLGMIVNELVSNSLKHAFIDRDEGEVRIKLHRDESTEFESKSSESTSTGTGFTLTISDNGVGVSENLDIENLESLGMQLVTSLVDQLDGELQLKRENGTEFTVRFKITEKNE